MQKIYLLVIFFIALALAIYAHSTQFSIFKAIHLVSRDTTYHIISSDGNLYGYEIFVIRNLLIHQPDIPGMPGIKRFARRSDTE